MRFGIPLEGANMAEDLPPAESGTEEHGALDISAATQAITGLMDRDDPAPEEPAIEEEQVSEEISQEAEGEEDDADAEYAPDDDDTETSDLADPDDEETEEQPEIQPRKYRVKAAGEDLEVSEEELVKGYQRERDYTRGKQEIAETRRNLDGELNAARAERERMLAALDAFEQSAEVVEAPDEDLREIDPMEYLLQKEKFDSHRTRLGQAEAEKQRIAKAGQAEHEQALKQMLEDENRKLIERVPGWADDEVRSSETKSMMKFAQAELGFSSDELTQIYDSRLVDALQRLWRYEKAAGPNSTARRKVKKAPKVVRSGARRPKSDEPKKLRDARRRLKDSGSVSDAADLIFQTLE